MQLFAVSRFSYYMYPASLCNGSGSGPAAVCDASPLMAPPVVPEPAVVFDLSGEMPSDGPRVTRETLPERGAVTVELRLWKLLTVRCGGPAGVLTTAGAFALLATVAAIAVPWLVVPPAVPVAARIATATVAALVVLFVGYATLTRSDRDPRTASSPERPLR
jgi:hypothetical protein